MGILIFLNILLILFAFQYKVCASLIHGVPLSLHLFHSQYRRPDSPPYYTLVSRGIRDCSQIACMSQGINTVSFLSLHIALLVLMHVQDIYWWKLGLTNLDGYALIFDGRLIFQNFLRTTRSISGQGNNRTIYRWRLYGRLTVYALWETPYFYQVFSSARGIDGRALG